MRNLIIRKIADPIAKNPNFIRHLPMFMFPLCLVSIANNVNIPAGTDAINAGIGLLPMGTKVL